MTDTQELTNRLVSLTRDLILIPSTESRPKERKKCFEFLQNHLDHQPGVTMESFECNGHQSLVVRPDGVVTPEILLCAHIDVIDHPQADCFRSRITDGRIYGPGSGDMKGQVAIIVELLKSLLARHPGLSLGLALTSDEELGGMDGVRYLCEDVGLRCGLAIIPDGGSLNDITIEEKGIIHARVSRRGREAHGARPWLGENAVELLMERLVRLRVHFLKYWPEAPIEEQFNHWFPTCCINIVETDNTTPNRIPDQASAILDIRFPPPHSVESVMGEVRRVLGADISVELMTVAEPTHLDSDPLFTQITEEVTGNRVRMVRASGGSDSRFFRAYDIPVNLSRPLVGDLHSIDEWIDIQSMVTYYQICEAYVLRKLI